MRNDLVVIMEVIIFLVFASIIVGDFLITQDYSHWNNQCDRNNKFKEEEEKK